jgi:CelD/BcsL family acetyltransferase involved in cellulose biosynthesis
MLEIVRDLSRLEAMSEPWRGLSVHNPVPMLSHEWTVAAARAFGKKAELAIFALWDGPKLRAVAPLGLFRSGFSQRLQFLAQEVYEPESLLFRDRASLMELLSAVTQYGPALSLAGLPRGGDEELVLRDMRGGSLTYFGRIFFSHAAVLPATGAQLDDCLSKSARTMFRRKLKQAEKHGPVTFSAETLDEQNWEAAIQDLIRIESSGWKRENGTSLVDLHDLRQFYEDYTRLKAASGALRAYRMQIAGQTVAIRLGAVADGRLYELKIGFDDNFRNCSPGMLLTHETLKAAIAEGLTMHEFLGGAEDWQKHWPLQIHEHVTIRRYPFAINGALILGQDVLGRVGGRVRQFAERRLANHDTPKPAEAA